MGYSPMSSLQARTDSICRHCTREQSLYHSNMNLAIFERKIFERIYGPKYENGEWKSRTNRELEEINKGENIVKWIKRQRISYLGHLERMEEDRMPKKIFTQEL